MENTKKKTKNINLKRFAKRLLVSFLFVYLLITLISQHFNFNTLNEENKVLDQKTKEAMVEQKNLNSELEAIDSEDFIRRVIRERLGYTRPNEKVFVDAAN